MDGKEPTSSSLQVFFFFWIPQKVEEEWAEIVLGALTCIIHWQALDRK